MTEASSSTDHHDDTFYAVLNVERDATDEEIKLAYKRLCIAYHPDKHRGSESLRQAAEATFSKIQKAFSVLSDPQARILYDTYGESSMTAGWELGPHLQTAEEIRAEYERIKAKKQEQRRRELTNSTGAVTLSLDLTGAFDDDYDSEVEITQISIQQSVQAPVSDTDTATIQGGLVTQNGRGVGSVSGSIKRQFSGTFSAEADLALGTSNQITGKLFKNIDKFTFASVSATGHLVPHGVGMSGNLIVGRQLTSSTTGYLTWKFGLGASMSTSFVHNLENGHITGTLQIGLLRTNISCGYLTKIDDQTKARINAKLALTGWNVEYGAERQLSEHNRFGLGISFGVPSGISIKMKFSRAGQSVAVPLKVSHDVTLVGLFLATTIPAAAAYFVYRIVLIPSKRREEQQLKERLRRERIEKTAEASREAEAAVKLMTETVARKMEQEEQRQGLIILQAWYGKLIVTAEELEQEEEDDGAEDHSGEVIDVTIPLQCITKDSKLHLAATSKSGILGFYDPCPGEAKQLRIRYKFKDQLHEVTCDDSEGVSLPKKSHLVGK